MAVSAAEMAVAAAGMAGLVAGMAGAAVGEVIYLVSFPAVEGVATGGASPYVSFVSI